MPSLGLSPLPTQLILHCGAPSAQLTPLADRAHQEVRPDTQTPEPTRYHKLLHRPLGSGHSGYAISKDLRNLSDQMGVGWVAAPFCFQICGCRGARGHVRPNYSDSLFWATCHVKNKYLLFPNIFRIFFGFLWQNTWAAHSCPNWLIAPFF